MLTSQLFAGDELLETIAAGGHNRISTVENNQHPAVLKVQTALLTWDENCLPLFGADGTYGSETAGAVHTFKVTVLEVPPDHVISDVGPQTVNKLDEIQTVAEAEGGPVTPTPARTRHDIWKLQPSVGAPWHPIVLAYAEAVGIMKQNTGTKNRWWSHQMQVHGMAQAPAGDVLRNQCQHASWFFLPWHRLYLYFFEQTVRSIILELPTVDDDVKRDWALPYWDYDRDDARRLPPAFRTQALPDGRPNPLFEGSRFAAINSGTAQIVPALSEARGWAYQTPFASSGSAGLPGRGLAGPKTGFSHNGDFVGPLEDTPHGAVHMTIGGLMMGFNRAAGDPVFWLHHANIDRAWEIWRSSTGMGADETDPAYFALSFSFLDQSGGQVTRTAADAVDTAAQLGYVYEDTSFPASAGPPPQRQRQRRRDMPQDGSERDVPSELGGPAEEPPPPERVGSSDSTVVLRDGKEASVEFSVERVVEPAADAVRFARSMPSERRVLLHLEHITAEVPSGQIYGVYVDPEGDGDPVHVGNLPLFGLAEANEPDSEHELAYVFDITDVVDDLIAVGSWDPARARFSFRVVSDPALDASPPTVSIGSVSVLIQ
jgi:tyrosinase